MFNHIVHYGVGQNTFKNDADAVRFVQHLIVNNVLMQNLRAVQDGFTTPFITLGKKTTLLRNREIQVFLAL